MNKAAWLLAFLCAAWVAACSQDAHQEAAAATIRALERAWVVAQDHNDNRALDRLFDNALVYIEYGQLLTKADYLSKVRTKNQQWEQIALEPMTVRTFGNTAIVVGTYQETDLKQGKPLQQRWRFIDTWVCKNGRWVLVAAAAARISR